MAQRQEAPPRPQGGRLNGQAAPPQKKRGLRCRAACPAPQVIKALNEQNEDQSYTILSDSTATIERARSDEMGPGQRIAAAITEVRSRRSDQPRKYPDVTMGPQPPWHRGKRDCRRLSGGMWGTPSRGLTSARPASPATTRMTTEARSVGVSKWTMDHVDRRRRYRPPKGQKLRKELRNERKAFVGRYY